MITVRLLQQKKELTMRVCLCLFVSLCKVVNIVFIIQLVLLVCSLLLNVNCGRFVSAATVDVAACACARFTNTHC
jgi:hypothetical protein